MIALVALALALVAAPVAADLWIARREQRRQRARELRRIVATVPGRPGRPPAQRLDVRTALRRECGR